MAKRVGHQWTKEQVRIVATQWVSATKEEIAKKLGVRTDQVNYIISQMRKAGFYLPKKHKKSELQSLLKECLKEMK